MRSPPRRTGWRSGSPTDPPARWAGRNGWCGPRATSTPTSTPRRTRSPSRWWTPMAGRVWRRSASAGRRGSATDVSPIGPSGQVAAQQAHRRVSWVAVEPLRGHVHPVELPGRQPGRDRELAAELLAVPGQRAQRQQPAAAGVHQPGLEVVTPGEVRDTTQLDDHPLVAVAIDHRGGAAGARVGEPDGAELHDGGRFGLPAGAADPDTDADPEPEADDGGRRDPDERAPPPPRRPERYGRLVRCAVGLQYVYVAGIPLERSVLALPVERRCAAGVGVVVGQLVEDRLPHPRRRGRQRFVDPLRAGQLDGAAELVDLCPALGADEQVGGHLRIGLLGRQGGEGQLLGVGVRRVHPAHPRLSRSNPRRRWLLTVPRGNPVTAAICWCVRSSKNASRTTARTCGVSLPSSSATTTASTTCSDTGAGPDGGAACPARSAVRRSRSRPASRSVT